MRTSSLYLLCERSRAKGKLSSHSGTSSLASPSFIDVALHRSPVCLCDLCYPRGLLRCYLKASLNAYLDVRGELNASGQTPNNLVMRLWICFVMYLQQKKYSVCLYLYCELPKLLLRIVRIWLINLGIYFCTNLYDHHVLARASGQRDFQ